MILIKHGLISQYELYMMSTRTFSLEATRNPKVCYKTPKTVILSCRVKKIEFKKLPVRKVLSNTGS